MHAQHNECEQSDDDVDVPVWHHEEGILSQKPSLLAAEACASTFAAAVYPQHKVQQACSDGGIRRQDLSNIRDP